MKLFVYLITLTLFTKAFAADPEMERLKPALDAITPDGLLAHIKMLSSDEFEGRAPGSKGEELSIKYISDQFKKIGLSPGNPDGTYFQKVPLAGIKTTPSASFALQSSACARTAIPSSVPRSSEITISMLSARFLRCASSWAAR